MAFIDSSLVVRGSAKIIRMQLWTMLIFLILISTVLLSFNAHADPIILPPGEMPPFESTSETGGQIEPPPYGSFSSSIWAVPSLIGFNYLPNLYFFLAFLLLVCGLREAQVGNIEQNKRRFIWGIFVTVAGITVLGSIIDILLLYQMVDEYYVFRYDAIAWLAAVSLIFLSIFLLTIYVLRLRITSAAVPAIGIAIVNPIIWYLIYNFKPDTLSVVILSLLFLPPSLYLLSRLAIWHKRIFGEKVAEAPREKASSKSRRFRDFHNDLWPRAAVALSVSLIVMFASLASTVAAENAYREEQLRKTELSVGVAGYLSSLNPFLAIEEADFFVISLLYDCLTTVNEDLEISPDLAQSWWYLDGELAAATGTMFGSFSHHKDPSDWPLGSIWEYNLTDGVYWSDGELFTADDVVWTLNILASGHMYSFELPGWYVQWIDHAEKVTDSKVRVFFTDINTREPVPVSFGDSLMIPILPKHVFGTDSMVSSILMLNNWTGAPSVGTGPFTAYSLGPLEQEPRTLVLRKNQYYDFIDNDGMNKGLGATYNRTCSIDNMIIKFFSDESEVSVAVLAGSCDVGRIPLNAYLDLMGKPTPLSNITLQSVITPDSYSKQIIITGYKTSLTELLRLDPAVMRAFSLAINKSFVVNSVYHGLAKVGYGLISPGNHEWYWEPDETMSTFEVRGAKYNSSAQKWELSGAVYSYTKPLNRVMEYDIAEANRILNAAGYVWANESGMIIRKAGPLAAARMEAMGFGNASMFLNKTLVFSHAIEQGIAEDSLVGDFLVHELEKIGVWIGYNGVHGVLPVNIAPAWTPYMYDTLQSDLRGDSDPNMLCFLPTSYALYGWNEFGTNSPEYDALYLRTVTTLDDAERKKWVDECQKWVYLSGSIIVTVYPQTSFAINTERWRGWDNWTIHPGMCMYNKWPANPLWFNLTPVEHTRAFSVSLSDFLVILTVATAVIAGTAIIMGYRRMAK